MATSGLYENDTEQSQHFKSIRMLARDLEMPEEEIRKVYEAVLDGLKARARIKDYLGLLVSRGVRNMMVKEKYMGSRVVGANGLDKAS